MVRSVYPAPPPPPMPHVKAAQLYLPDAISTLQRGLASWNGAQMDDALRSAEAFISEAKQALSTRV